MVQVSLITFGFHIVSMHERQGVELAVHRTVGKQVPEMAVRMHRAYLDRLLVERCQLRTVIGDVRRLRESIEHVLHNAVAYTEHDGHIALKASGGDAEAVITISDDGPGIEPENQSNVFKRFHRIGGGVGRGEAALGLGLPLTRQFIEAHGGTVELDSTPGKGTIVTLTIPRAPL